MLLRRGKTYYCRIWVPLELRNLIGRKEFKKSLCTSNKKEAKASAAALIYKTERAFLRMRAGMLTERELEIISGQLIAEFTGSIDEHRKQRKSSFEFLSSGKIPPGIDINFGGFELIENSLSYRKSAEEVQALIDTYTQRIQAFETELQTGLFSDSTRTQASKLATEKNLDIELPSADWFNPDENEWLNEPPADFGRLCETVVAAMIDSQNVAAELALAKNDTPLQQRIAAKIEAAKVRPKLTDLWAAYCKAKQAKNSWRTKTAKGNQDKFDEAVKIMGNTELAKYTEDIANSYIIVLQKRGNTAGTVTGKVELVSSLFKYAIKTAESQELWKVRGNPFAEKQVASTTPASERKKKPYTNEDLHNLLCGLLEVRKLVEPHRFWVPLIALYTGMRQQEICQLRCDDIEFEDGIDIFRIKHCPEHRQEVKASDVRICPMHPVLRILGFKNYLQKQRETKQDRLFSTLEYNSKGWTGKIRSWWNEQFQKKYVEDTERKSFHSLRGTLINQFKQQGVYKKATDRAILQSMVGHEADDVTGEHYEEDFPVSEKYRLMRKLNYKIDPDLMHKLANKQY